MQFNKNAHKKFRRKLFEERQNEVKQMRLISHLNVFNSQLCSNVTHEIVFMN